MPISLSGPERTASDHSHVHLHVCPIDHCGPRETLVGLSESIGREQREQSAEDVRRTESSALTASADSIGTVRETGLAGDGQNRAVRSAPAEYEVRWGLRARAGIDKRTLLELVCKVYGEGCELQEWSEHWDVIRNEQATRQARDRGQ